MSPVESAAMRELGVYIRSAGPDVNEHDELIARDSFMTGFAAGVAWTEHTRYTITDRGRAALAGD